MSKDCTFGILISNFGSTMQLRTKDMVVSYVVAAPAVIIDLTYDKAIRAPQEDSNLVRQTSTIAAAHHKPTKYWEVRLT